jgi:mRNA-degrading endonuclease RelE of RelBE toxin-antitoxin system
MNYEESKEFLNDLKKLLKKFPSLKDDLGIAKRAVIELRHIQEIDNQSVFQISGYTHKHFGFWKIKKFACKSLKGRGARSGIRIIYAFYPKENKVVFLEIYFKGKKENEDKERIKDYLK